MSAETVELAERLEFFVLGRTSTGASVAVLGQARKIARALRGAGREVLDAAPGATHIVLAPDESLESLEGLLRGLREVAPGAEVLFGFSNAGASSALLATLVGQPLGPRVLSESRVIQVLQAAGYRVERRVAFPAPARTTSLAEGTEQGLRALFEQLSPSAVADVVLYAVRPEAQPAEVEPVPGLLSVVLWTGRPGTARLLDEALFSLACQEYRPLEVLLVGPEEGSAATREALARYRQLGDFEVRHVHGPGPGLMQEALGQARGQYLSFLDAAWVVYPAHFLQLVRALQSGPAAWAIARARRTVLAPTESGTPYARSKVAFPPLEERLELEHLLREPELLYALAIDRTRLGPFPLTVEDPSAGRLDALPVRLAVLFAPAFSGGLYTCEARALNGQRAVAAEVPALHVLRSLAATEERVALARAELEARFARYRVLDTLNSRLREGAPWLHSALRSAASRLRQRT